MSNLVQWEKIGSEIALAKDWDEIKNLSDKLAAFKIWAKQSKQSLETQNKIAEYRLRLERKKGEWLSENELANGQFVGGKVTEPPNGKPTLADLNITKYESHVAQQIAAIPEERFEKHISENRNELTNCAPYIIMFIPPMLFFVAHLSDFCTIG